jgi:hypothetical protein
LYASPHISAHFRTSFLIFHTFAHIAHIHIWNTRSHFVDNFPNINILVNIALIIPLSNANVERVFSQHKLTKTRLRNRMNVESLESHLMTLLNAPDNIEDFDWNKAFDQWEKEQVRRINQNKIIHLLINIYYNNILTF